MIKYTLKCEYGHEFDSWFASAGAYEAVRSGGHVVCAVCGSESVEKAIMAPRVATARTKAGAPDHGGERPLSTPGNEAEAALSKMRADIEKNATYVGGSFAKEARDMHLGDVPDRPIWGEANAKEAKALIEDGVPVAPLPFVPTRKAN